MAKTGKKPEKILRAWEVLTKKAGGSGLNNKIVYEPLELLQLNGPMSYGTASQTLTKLEDTDYLRKHTNGTVRLLYVELLKTGPLGEDILGKQDAKEPAQKPRSPRKTNHEPTQEQEHTGVIDPKSNGLDGVIVLCDYENLSQTLEREKTKIDYNDLIERARKYGTIRVSTAFIPMHTPLEIQMQLRMARFRVESCPPRKPLGKDTCDQAIEEFVRLLLDHPNIRTFVLVSGDGDFVDILGEIENWGKKWVLFHYNYVSTSANLISKKGVIVNLAEILPKIPKVEITQRPEPMIRPEIYAANGLNPNVYAGILHDLQNGRRSPHYDIHFRFLRAIISCLKNKGLASEYPMRRRSLTEIRTAIWQELSGHFNENLSEEDCRLALSALRDFSIIKSAPHGKHQTYYVFNPNHGLVTRVLNPDERMAVVKP